MNKLKNKRVLIMSRGPVPMSEDAITEGGGLRSWGLATGLIKNNPKLDITVAYESSYYDEKIHRNNVNSIKITTWDSDNIKSLVGSADSVISLYSDTAMTGQVITNLTKEQQLILDCYVPIYIEIPARDSDDLEREYNSFENEVPRFNEILTRGDIFLCANQKQKDWYYGVLSALGRINPLTYNDSQMIQVVPYGIPSESIKINKKPITEALKNNKSFKLLWFGGIYPWFNLEGLIDAVIEVNKTKPCELFMVGAKNPFNAHPDFVAKYEKTLQYIENKASGCIHLVDWVPFNSRGDWYKDADLIITMNKTSIENKYAWRTRLVDYVWAGTPIMTNGGDPLSDVLVENNAAIIIKNDSAEEIKNKLVEVINGKIDLISQTDNLKKVQKTLYWENITKKLTKLIDEKYFALDHDKKKINTIIEPVIIKPTKIIRLLKSINDNGLIATFNKLTSKVHHKFFQQNLPNDQTIKPKIKIWTHELSFSGAPEVLLDILDQWIDTGGDVSDFEIYYPSGSVRHKSAKTKFEQYGINVIESKVYNQRFNLGDTVVVNSASYPNWFFDDLLTNLENGNIEHVFWYIHEDDERQISAFWNFNQLDAKSLEEKIVKERYENVKERLISQIKHGKISLYIPSSQSADKWNKWFGFDAGFKIMPGRIKIAKENTKTIKEEDFNKINFITTGTIEARKGQLSVVEAMVAFEKIFYQANSNKYRDFHLTLLGLDPSLKNEYYPRFVENISKSLPEKIRLIDKKTQAEALKDLKLCNLTVAYSLVESFSMATMEGMAFGHPIIRSEASGQKEQLRPGKNGWAVRTDDWWGLVETIEEVLNKEKTSNIKLANMSKESLKIALKNIDMRYEIISDIEKEVRK